MHVPFDDPSIGRLARELRVAIAAHWTRRAQSEREVGGAFATMVPVVRARGASREVVLRLVRGVEEEARHAVLCEKLAAAYAGDPSEGAADAPRDADAPRSPVPLPRFGMADEDLETALLVAGMCCVNETIATAWLTAGLAVATAPIAVVANRIHLRYEIEHARLGWAHLASRAVSDETRAGLSACLPDLLEANAPGWEQDDPSLPPEGCPAHGHLSADASRDVVRDALRDLVVPGFAHVGVDPGPAETWLTRRYGPRP